ncbi:MAG: sel1 repeat family protein [Clostridia bacterium]|nr:sel1 repeat family protein [Clostridia bacterium]MBP3649220.1 sel1 repeat family protein [Clostridia bacterium]
MKKLIALVLAAMLLLTAAFALAEEAPEATAESNFADLLAAAEGGDGVAMGKVGVMYFQGAGVEQDLKAAYDWFMKSAELGEVTSIYNVGVFHYFGYLGEVNYEEALAWFQKAADQGHAAAHVNLGSMYRAGQGTEVDKEKALEMYQKAAELFQLAAEGGNGEAAYNLGVMAQNGEGMEADTAKSMEWYSLSADLGYAKGQTTMGALYLGANGVEEDFDKAFRYFFAAMQQGDLDALYFVGMCFEKGLGTEMDEATAVYCYQMAAELGHQGAAERLEVIAQMEEYMKEAEGAEQAGE